MILRRMTMLFGVLGCLMMLAPPQSKAQINDPTNVHITCNSPTVCFAGSVGQVTTIGTQNPVFSLNMQPQSGEGTGISTASGIGNLVLKVLVPDSSSLASGFSVCLTAGCGSSALLYEQKGSNGTSIFNSGKIDDFLGATFQSTSASNFSSYASASAQSGAGTPTGFNVYLVNLGAFSSGSTISLQGFSGNLPVGTVIIANVINCDPTASGSNCFTNGSTAISGQTAVNGVPLSESLTINGPGGAVPEPSSLALFGSGIVVLGGFLRRRLGL